MLEWMLSIYSLLISWSDTEYEIDMCHIQCLRSRTFGEINLTNKTNGNKPNPLEATSVATRMGALPFLNSKKNEDRRQKIYFYMYFIHAPLIRDRNINTQGYNEHPFYSSN